MLMDRSQDNRSPDDVRPRQNDTDPWGEFLSESSDELLQLQRTHSGGSDTGDGDRHAGIRIVPLLEPSTPSSPADEFLPSETATPSLTVQAPLPAEAPLPERLLAEPTLAELPLPEAPAQETPLPEAPPVVAPAPRDGAPPFTRRVSYGRTYESPLTAAAPPSDALPTSQDVSRPPVEAPFTSSLLQSTPADEARRSLFNPEVTSTPGESIWKTPPSVLRDETSFVAARHEEPLVPPAFEPDDMPAVVSASPEAQPVRSSPPPRAPVVQGADSLLLSEVLERRTPVHWSEAVAAVEELCVAIDAGPSDTEQVPDLVDVFITPDGLVGVRQGAAGEPDVAALGRALHTLIGTGETPLPLRLFVTSAVSADRFASVALFADALSYYALPDRAQLIQALYKRAMQRRPALPAVTPSKQRVIPSSSASPAQNRDRMMKTWTMAAAAGIVVGAFVGVWLWSAGLSSEAAVTVPVKKVAPPAPKRTEDWTPGPILVEGARPAVPPARSEARTQTAARAEKPSTSTQRPAPIPPLPQVSLNARPAPAPVLPATQPVTVAAAPATVTSSGTTTVTSPAPPSNTGAAVFSSTPTPPAVARAPVVVDAGTYSAADDDVDPPVLLTARPILPAPTWRKDAVATRTFELVVDHEGRVQSSKLLEDSASFTDMGLTQQLKLLRFRPATKAGRPVKYRYRLRLTSNPE